MESEVMHPILVLYFAFKQEGDALMVLGWSENTLFRTSYTHIGPHLQRGRLKLKIKQHQLTTLPSAVYRKKITCQNKNGGKITS